MRYIHCTQKLIKEIDPKIKSKGIEREVKGLGDWYSNVFSSIDFSCIIFTNVKTLYSFVIPEIYRDDIEHFGKLFINGLIYSLELNGIKKEIIEKIIEEYAEFEIVKTNSLSILASMNDFIRHYRGTFEDGRNKFVRSIDDFNKTLVKTPVGTLNYKFPIEKLYELIDKEIIEN